MEILFDNQVIVITGGAGGIGQACAEAYLRSNAKVAIVDRKGEHLQKAVEKLSKWGTVQGYAADLSQPEAIQNTVSEILKDFSKIDILVCAAGFMNAANSNQIDEALWDQMMNVNIKGSFFMAKTVKEMTMIHQGGSILFFSSAAAIRGFPGNMASPHYSASKGALISLARQLAVEWGTYDIRVNAIVPGGVLTPAMAKMAFDNEMTKRIPLQRLAKPCEIANTVLFLTSKASSMITGQAIVVDGGANIVGQ